VLVAGLLGMMVVRVPVRDKAVTEQSSNA